MKHCLGLPSSSWHRLKNKQQAEALKGYHLLYPADDSNKTTDTPLVETLGTQINSLRHPPTDSEQEIKGLLLIDATWQESQKMMRQSPWLMQLPKLSLQASESQYLLRRNQSESGLCTLESLAHALHALHHRKNSQDLLQFFHIFQDAFLQIRQSGQLNPRTP